MKKEVWFVWDSRGGLRHRPQAYQLVNFSLKKNLDDWRMFEPGATITGSIESGRITIKNNSTVIEFWREDKPNPTPDTQVDNPDRVKSSDIDFVTDEE